MRWKNVVLVVLAAVVINLPVVSHAIREHRLDSSGVDVRADLVQARVVGGQRFLTFAVPADSPRHGDAAFKATVRVDAAAYDTARSAGAVDVRVLPGSTTAWRADGEVTSRAGLWLTVGADLVLLVLVLLYVRFRTRLRPTLVLAAEGDPAPDPDVDLLDRLGGQRYLVRGVVLGIAEGAFVLDVDERRVRVELGGRAVAVAPGDRIRVVGTMVA